MAKVTCPQPPTGKCTQTLVPFNNIEVAINVCNIMSVGDTLVHEFNHDGDLHVLPNPCFYRELDSGPFHKGDTTKEDEATLPGIVFMFFVDKDDPDHPKLFSEILIISPAAGKVPAKSVVEPALEQLIRTVQSWPENL
jgi:hypothetical protein